jgi:hypothetical protein
VVGCPPSIRKNAYSLRGCAGETLRSMSRIYRTEVRASDKFGSAEGLPRFVVIVEISDDVVSALGNSSPQLQIKAYEVAMDATQLQRANNPNVAFRGWSNTVMVDVNLADYGEPNHEADDGCRAWIIEAP